MARSSYLAHTSAVVFADSAASILRRVGSEKDALARLSAIMTVRHTIWIGLSSGRATFEMKGVAP